MTHTERFRRLLEECNVVNPASYEWDDEPLYQGDPLSGRMSPNESRAVDRMNAWLRLNQPYATEDFWRWVTKAMTGRERLKIGNVEFWRERNNIYYDLPTSQWEMRKIAADLITYVDEAKIMLG